MALLLKSLVVLPRKVDLSIDAFDLERSLLGRSEEKARLGVFVFVACGLFYSIKFHNSLIGTLSYAIAARSSVSKLPRYCCFPLIHMWDSNLCKCNSSSSNCN